MLKAKRAVDGKEVHGEEIVDQFMEMPGTWLVTKNEAGYEATKIDPATIEEE